MGVLFQSEPLLMLVWDQTSLLHKASDSYWLIESKLVDYTSHLSLFCTLQQHINTRQMCGAECSRPYLENRKLRAVNLGVYIIVSRPLSCSPY